MWADGYWVCWFVVTITLSFLQGVGPLTLITKQLIGQQSQVAAGHPITGRDVDMCPPWCFPAGRVATGSVLSL